MGRFQNIAFTFVLGMGLFVAPFPGNTILALTIDDGVTGAAPLTIVYGAESQRVQIPRENSTPSFQEALTSSGTSLTGYKLNISERATLVLVGAAFLGLATWGRRRMRRRANAP